jgi:hypothetical protein
MNHLSKIEDAERVVTKGAEPRYTRQDYEQSMLDLAKSEANEGESPACAFARLCETDPRMDRLYKAACAAIDRTAEREERELLTKRATRNDHIFELMVKSARVAKRPSETVEEALDRMLRTDKVFSDAYELYCE